jgi:hypothetical protein
MIVDVTAKRNVTANEFSITFLTISWFPAPLFCETRVVAAIVIPIMNEISIKMIGNVRVIALNSFVPRKRPIQKALIIC